jgi:hypothetical protein
VDEQALPIIQVDMDILPPAIDVFNTTVGETSIKIIDSHGSDTALPKDGNLFDGYSDNVV